MCDLHESKGIAFADFPISENCRLLENSANVLTDGHIVTVSILMGSSAIPPISCSAGVLIQGPASLEISKSSQPNYIQIRSPKQLIGGVGKRPSEVGELAQARIPTLLGYSIRCQLVIWEAEWSNWSTRRCFLLLSAERKTKRIVA